MKNANTKKSTKSEIATLIATGDRASKYDANELEILITRLQFWQASPNTPRGISDTGLDDATLNACLTFAHLPYYTKDLISAYLASE